MFEEKTADKQQRGEQKLGHPEMNASLSLWRGRSTISHFPSSEEERGKQGERSKSESLYPTSMINVRGYASEAAVQRGWHLAEFPCMCL